jgi:hypothetical protein
MSQPGFCCPTGSNIYVTGRQALISRDLHCVVGKMARLCSIHDTGNHSPGCPRRTAHGTRPATACISAVCERGVLGKLGRRDTSRDRCPPAPMRDAGASRAENVRASHCLGAAKRAAVRASCAAARDAAWTRNFFAGPVRCAIPAAVPPDFRPHRRSPSHAEPNLPAPRGLFRRRNRPTCPRA